MASKKVIVITHGVLSGLKGTLIKRHGSGYVNVRLLDNKGAYRINDTVTLGPGDWKEWERPAIRFSAKSKSEPSRTIVCYPKDIGTHFELEGQVQFLPWDEFLIQYSI